jgi:hypothetical protein
MGAIDGQLLKLFSSAQVSLKVSLCTFGQFEGIRKCLI